MFYREGDGDGGEDDDGGFMRAEVYGGWVG